MNIKKIAQYFGHNIFFSAPYLWVISPEEKEKLVKTGNLLRALRIEKNLSQKQLAFEIGVSRSQYQYMENGEANFGIISVYRLAEVLEVDPRIFIVASEITDIK